MSTKYEKPLLVSFNAGKEEVGLGKCQSGGSNPAGNCQAGTIAQTGNCIGGTTAGGCPQGNTPV